MMRLTKLKPMSMNMNMHMESLSYQLIQRCSVSGTAKGKAKLKTGKVLIKGKFKKGGASSSTSIPEPGPRKKTEFDDMVENCLNATSPIRYLKPKEKAREAEREKMDLISKAREEEKQKMKKKQKEFDSPFLMGTPGLDLITLGLVDEEKIPKYELTVEDGRKLAKEYSRVLMRRHRARQAAETAFLKMKKEAIEALPEGLKAAAMVPDFTPFPANRFMATLTPPIEGYNEKIKEAARQNSGKTKLR